MDISEIKNPAKKGARVIHDLGRLHGERETKSDCRAPWVVEKRN